MLSEVADPHGTLKSLARHRRGPLLSVTGVSVQFGGVRVLRDAAFEVQPGEVHGLIGPNGAGKSTLLDVISGFVQHSQGDVRLAGQSISGLKPHQRARLGLGRTFQSLELYHDLSVRENLAVGRIHGRRPTPADVVNAAERLGVVEDLDRPVNELAHGRRRLVSVARAMLGPPSVLLLDEPAAGLDHAQSAELGQVLRSLVTDDTALVLVEHDVLLVMGVSDRVTVLEVGTVICTGSPDTVRNNPLVRAAYLGDETCYSK